MFEVVTNRKIFIFELDRLSIFVPRMIVIWDIKCKSTLQVYWELDQLVIDVDVAVFKFQTLAGHADDTFAKYTFMIIRWVEGNEIQSLW